MEQKNPLSEKRDAPRAGPIVEERGDGGLAWPSTMKALEEAGYGYTGTSKLCSCGTTILWFITPARKWMPISALKDSRLVPHHSVCERVKQFRAANKQHAARADKPKPKQLSLLGEKNG